MSTTLNTLLDNLKQLSKDYANGTKGTTLKGTRTWKKGILSPNTVYPAIALVPRYELLGGYRSGGVYKSNKLINTEIIVKQSRSLDAGKYLQELSTSYIEMFYDTTYPNNYKMSDTVFDVSPGRIEYDVIGDKENNLQRALVPIVFSSWEQAPSFTTSSSITDTDLRNVGEYIYNLLKGSSSLSKVSFFYSHAFPPLKVGSGCVVTILEDTDERNKRETGRDNPLGTVDIVIWTKASAYEGSLEYNLEIAELIKSILQEDVNLGGRVYKSNISRIEFGINYESLLYGSRIVFQTFAYNSLPQY